MRWTLTAVAASGVLFSGALVVGWVRLAADAQASSAAAAEPSAATAALLAATLPVLPGLSVLAPAPVTLADPRPVVCAPEEGCHRVSGYDLVTLSPSGEVQRLEALFDPSWSGRALAVGSRLDASPSGELVLSATLVGTERGRSTRVLLRRRVDGTVQLVREEPAGEGAVPSGSLTRPTSGGLFRRAPDGSMRTLLAPETGVCVAVAETTTAIHCVRELREPASPPLADDD